MKTSPFSDSKLCIILTYAPAGLGHLRVTDALRHGLPETTQPILLPESSESIRWIHRLTSRNPLGKKLMEWGQYGQAEETITKIYRWLLVRDAKYLEPEIQKIFKQRVVRPEKILIVASHYGLAHQLSVMKKKIERSLNVKIIIAMQVTDDSPQKIWYVPGIDLITVPSLQTKNVLSAYGRSHRLAPSPISVLPYPVSPHLSEELLPAAKKHRVRQLALRGGVPINVSIPISGAGVGTMYANLLMHELHKQNRRYMFHIVAKRAIYTDMFLQSLNRKDYVEVSSSHSDREIVELYEQLFDRVVLSLEVTKPSEQAFKALCTPKQSGGVILLFSSPVGRQEYDNLDFLTRHGLMPTPSEHETLLTWSLKKTAPTGADARWLIENAKHWRGLRLPNDPMQAAVFIEWCHFTGVFSLMADLHTFPRPQAGQEYEVGNDGVMLFWKEVGKLL